MYSAISDLAYNTARPLSATLSTHDHTQRTSPSGMQLRTFSALPLSAIAAASASSESTPAPVVDHLFPSSAGALEIQAQS